MPVLDIKITAREALKPLTTLSFIKSSLTLSTWEHSMSLSRSFLQMIAENQNFLQPEQKSWHCQLWQSVKCWSNVGYWLLITNVGIMLGSNWPNLIPTAEKVIFRQWMYKVYPVSIQPWLLTNIYFVNLLLQFINDSLCLQKCSPSYLMFTESWWPFCL